MFNKKIKKNVSIEGMMCDNCANHVNKSLSKIDGVTRVKVSLKNKNAVIESSKDISDSEIKTKVAEAGYTVTDIK